MERSMGMKKTDDLQKKSVLNFNLDLRLTDFSIVAQLVNTLQNSYRFFLTFLYDKQTLFNAVPNFSKIYQDFWKAYTECLKVRDPPPLSTE